MKHLSVKVSNLNKIANQFLIRTSKGSFFQSYNTVIAFRANDGTITLDPNWDYSRTTGRSRNSFLNETKKVTEQKIKSGEYLIENLNPGY